MKGRFGIVPSAWLDRSDVGMAEIAVLTALSTFADKDGYCFPSQRRIADQLGKSQPWVSKILGDLVDRGLIRRRQRNASRSYEYFLLYDNHQPADTHYQPADIDDQPADTNSTNNKTNNNSPVRGRSRSLITSEFTPLDTDIERALKAHAILTSEIITDETAKFVDYWLSKGELKADWNAAYRNWLRNAAKFATRDNTLAITTRRKNSQSADERRNRITDAAMARPKAAFN